MRFVRSILRDESRMKSKNKDSVKFASFRFGSEIVALAKGCGDAASLLQHAAPVLPCGRLRCRCPASIVRSRVRIFGFPHSLRRSPRRSMRYSLFVMIYRERPGAFRPRMAWNAAIALIVPSMTMARTGHTRLIPRKAFANFPGDMLADLILQFTFQVVLKGRGDHWLAPY